MKFLLDYVFPISVVTPTPEASTAFLKQVCVIAKPKSGQEGNVGNIYECSTMTEVAARTDNTNAQQLFNAGMSKVYVLLSSDLDVADALADGAASDFYTVLLSDDFDDADIPDAKATGVVTVTNYANLVSGTDDVVTIGGVAFTAQAGAATLGETTFQSATSNNATAASLAAQINAHTATAAKVTASVLGAVVTLTAKNSGFGGNDITLTYTDNDTNVGITLSGLSAGKLTGGTGLSLGTFDGVVGFSSDDQTVLATQAAIENRVAFFGNSTNKAKNMFYAFGKILSNVSTWANQQYITMPYDDGIDTLGDANSLYDDKISFALSDDEFGKRLALFCVGGKAIVAPYILKNLRIDLQSAALTWISGNQPSYTKKEAALLETRLQQDVINEDYIDRNLIEAGTVEISLVQSNFVANGSINVAEPKALWRVFSEMRQTL
jgi:hypothetical protein